MYRYDEFDRQMVDSASPNSATRWRAVSPAS